MAKVVKKLFLVDTQVFLWFLMDDVRLGEAKSVIADRGNRMFLSSASVWEIMIKMEIGKLKVPANLKEAIDTSGLEVLPIELDHVLQLGKLPKHKNHKDPFDRILVSQAIAERLCLLTADKKMESYKVDLVRV